MKYKVKIQDEKCWKCGEPIGFSTAFLDNSRAENRFRHALCNTQEAAKAAGNANKKLLSEILV